MPRPMNELPRLLPTNWLHRLRDKLLHRPSTRAELVKLLHDAKKHQLLDSRSLAMIEGVLEVSQMQVRDIMIPRAQMITIEKDASLATIVPIINETRHSRFPVTGENRDDIIGILLAKDLVRYCFSNQDQFNIMDILHPAIFIPESKRLNVLLEEFRLKHQHMAMIADEYGGVAGLVTIEDVLEEIVGEIEDEYDFEDEPSIKKMSDRVYIVKGLTPIDSLNEALSAHFSQEEFDTIGGFVAAHFGRLPKRGETTIINGIHFEVTHADKRRIGLLKLTLPKV